MMQGTKPLAEKENSIQEFTVLFWEDRILIDGHDLPLGQTSTEVLDHPDEKLLDMQKKMNAFLGFMQNHLFAQDIKKDLALVTAAQQKLNEVLEEVFALPLFRLLDMDRERMRSMLIKAFEQHPKEFHRMLEQDTPEHAILMDYFRKLAFIPDGLHSFKSYVAALCDLYFDRLKLRNPESYAVGLYDFMCGAQVLSEISALLPPTPFQDFCQTASVMLEFVTMPHPQKKEIYILAERTVFHHFWEFLQVDLFRALMHGHAPRRCKNCGRFFLLTAGYNAVYCNRIAPGEATRTCQKIGAHKMALQNQQYKTPERKLYDKVYNRLKTRKNRGNLMSDEWNMLLQQAWAYKEKTERGEMTFHELEKILGEM